jgi:hypothetical protein
VRQEDLRRLLRRDPCPLLRLHMTGGQVFEIRDPDEAVLDRGTVDLLLPREGDKQREAVVSLLHIVWIEVVSSVE